MSTFLIGAIALGILLFLPAWTSDSLNDWQIWLFVAVFLTASNAFGVYLSMRDRLIVGDRNDYSHNGCADLENSR